MVYCFYLSKFLNRSITCLFKANLDLFLLLIQDDDIVKTEYIARRSFMLDGRDLQLLSNLLDQKLDEKLKPIQEDISVLKVEMKEVKQDIAVLKEDVAILKEDVRVLKVEMKAVKQDIAVLKEDVAVLKEDVAVLKEDVAVLKEDVAILKLDSAELKKGVRKLNDDLRNLRIDHSRVEKKIDDYYDRIENTYVTEKENRSNYREKLQKSLDELIDKAKKVCPLSSHLITYMSLQVAHEDWGYAS